MRWLWRLWSRLMCRLHVLTADYCDGNCPCFVWGMDYAKETVGDWHRPPGY